MCGRYTNLMTWREMVDLYRITETGNAPNLPPRYNIAPTQAVPIVRPLENGDGRELAMVRWGLIPHWARDKSIAANMINARAETVSEKPSFRDPFRRRRCLVPADGYYEWQVQAQGPKQPFRIMLKGGKPFAFAGLWERWEKGPDGPIETCTIITTEANDALKPIHDRMPVILDVDRYDDWLGPDQPTDALLAMLGPCPSERVTAYPVSRRVNNVRNDDEGCVARA